MKKHLAIAIMMVLFLSTGFSQDENIRTYPLEITFNKTSSIVFPTIIKSVDRGSKDVLAQKAKGIGNVLQVKAARHRFPETSLTVITADGTLHQFTVNYADTPKLLTLNVNPGNTNLNTKTIVFENTITEDDLKRGTEYVLNAKQGIHFQSEEKYKVALTLKNIYIKEDVMFFHLQATNKSNINYTVDFLRFFIRDNRKAKRTATQEVEIEPIFVNQEISVVKGKSTRDWVFAVNKFTIPEAKHLTIEMFERQGGRHLTLPIKNYTIVKARALP